MAGYTKEVKQAARDSYIYERLSCEQIATRLRVPIRTLFSWRKRAKKLGDDWDTSRSALRLTSRGDEILHANVLEDIVLMFQGVMNDLKTGKFETPIDRAEALSRCMDAYVKAVSAVKKAAPQLNVLSIRMELLQKLVAYVGDNFPQHAAPLAEVFDGFAQLLSKEMA